MNNIKTHFNQFDYKEKSYALKVADFCNQGLYAYLESKPIKFYQDIHTKMQYTLFPSRPLAIAILISLIVFPFLLFTLSFKLLSREQAKCEEKFKNLAANKIQKAFRAYVTRRNFRIYLKDKRDKKIALAKIRIKENFKIHLSHTKAIQNKYILFKRMKNKIKNKVEKYLPDPSQRAQLIQEGVIKVEQVAICFLCTSFMTQFCYAVGIDPSLVQETIDIEKFQKTHYL